MEGAVKIWLTTTAPNVDALATDLTERLPRYRCAIRTGRYHRFLVVSGGSPGAAIVVSAGKTIKVFGGFRAQWLHVGWLLAMYCFGVMFVVGGINFITAVARSAEPGSAGMWQALALAVLVAGFEIRRRWSRPIIRDVVDSLQPMEPR